MLLGMPRKIAGEIARTATATTQSRGKRRRANPLIARRQKSDQRDQQRGGVEGIGLIVLPKDSALGYPVLEVPIKCRIETRV